MSRGPGARPGRTRGVAIPPDEIRPPIDVAAAVAAQVAGGEASAAAPSGPPRWYRAAGLVAAAAAIVLGVMILPRLTGDEPQEQSITAAAGADTGSAPEAGAAVRRSQDGAASAPRRRLRRNALRDLLTTPIHGGLLGDDRLHCCGLAARAAGPRLRT